MHGQTNTPAPLYFTAKTQADRLLATRRTLSQIGADIATAARLAAAQHMAASAPNAQNPRDQAATLRDLVASMTNGGAR